MGASKCEICGSRESLIVHHRSYEPEVTELLCRSCHRMAHLYGGGPQSPHTTIGASFSILTKLESLKKHPRESYEEVILRLIRKCEN